MRQISILFMSGLVLLSGQAWAETEVSPWLSQAPRWGAPVMGSSEQAINGPRVEVEQGVIKRLRFNQDADVASELPSESVYQTQMQRMDEIGRLEPRALEDKRRWQRHQQNKR